jgi:Ca2+-binding EF-hand superfamily protein
LQDYNLKDNFNFLTKNETVRIGIIQFKAFMRDLGIFNDLQSEKVFEKYDQDNDGYVNENEWNLMITPL